MTTAIVVAIGYVAALAVALVGYGLVRSSHRPAAADFVVVLGSTLSDGGRVPPQLANRLDRAHAVFSSLHAAGSDPVVIVSGSTGPTHDQVPEADAMAEYLLGHGLPADRLLREDRARSTEENLRYSGRLMRQVRPDGYRCTVVTTSLHCLRAALLVRRLGVPGEVIGAPTSPGLWWPTAGREFAALLVGYWKINLLLCALLAGLAWWR